MASKDIQSPQGNRTNIAEKNRVSSSWSAGNQIGPGSRRLRDRQGAQRAPGRSQPTVSDSSTSVTADPDASKRFKPDSEATVQDKQSINDVNAKTRSAAQNDGNCSSPNGLKHEYVYSTGDQVTSGTALKRDYVYTASDQVTSGRNTTVVNVHKLDLNKLGYRDLEHWLSVPGNVYIGRDMSRYVPGAGGSMWGNPFRSRKLGNTESCQMYRQYIINDTRIQSNGKTLLGSLSELKGKSLGCWCQPEQCHGHVLVELIAEYCP